MVSGESTAQVYRMRVATQEAMCQRQLAPKLSLAPHY